MNTCFTPVCGSSRRTFSPSARYCWRSTATPTYGNAPAALDPALRQPLPAFGPYEAGVRTPWFARRPALIRSSSTALIRRTVVADRHSLRLASLRAVAPHSCQAAAWLSAFVPVSAPSAVAHRRARPALSDLCRPRSASSPTIAFPTLTPAPVEVKKPVSSKCSAFSAVRVR